MTKIEMLDDEGRVTETIDVEPHRCGDDCECVAVCETCGAKGDAVSIFIWKTAAGMDYFSCGPCVEADDYCRFEVATKSKFPNTSDYQQAVNPEGVALLLQGAIDDSGISAHAVDYQDPRPIEGNWVGTASQFELKVGDRIYWVTVEEGF